MNIGEGRCRPPTTWPTPECPGRPGDPGRHDRAPGRPRLRGLTVEAVAARAGVGKSTIYRRWPSKATLAAAAVNALARERVPVPDTGDLRDDLVRLITEPIGRHGEVLGRIFPDLIAEMHRNPELSGTMLDALGARRA